MKIRFISAKQRKNKMHTSVLQALTKLGHEADFEIIAKKSEPYKKDFDIMVVDVEQPDTAIGCRIVLALADRKPVLCLYPEGYKDTGGILPPEREKYLKFLTIKCYNNKNLKEIIRDFLEEKGTQMHNRFNFFVSSDVSNYLDWITFARQQARADFIRRLIRDEMAEDKQYVNYLKSKKK
ncbi:hypothetical protein CL633_02950 [bacterium]|nr:hypothetical protein [bacterium]|tara:strand:+ start:730 stop:1269 length:540 start_codon:yes stop_codon:yes gene_type:complete